MLITPSFKKSLIVEQFQGNYLKAKIKGVSAGHIVAMVSYCVTKIIPTCSPMIGQFFDTMIVASIDKEW